MKQKKKQNGFARAQVKEYTQMATTFVGRLQPPPANPQSMIYDLVCHSIGGLIWTLQQTKTDMERCYCKLCERREFVEIEQAHFETVIHQHHPDYQGEAIPLTQSRADVLVKEMIWRVNELLGPLSKIKSDDARNNLHGEIERFTKKTIARYTVEPFGKNELIKEMAALQQLILRWISRWQLPISPQNIAYHVHWAFSDYGDAIRDSGGPLPPPSDTMRPTEGVHYLESLIRRLEELGEQEYFDAEKDDDGDNGNYGKRDKPIEADSPKRQPSQEEILAVLAKLNVNETTRKTCNWPEFVNRKITAELLTQYKSKKGLDGEIGADGRNHYLVADVVKKLHHRFAQ